MRYICPLIISQLRTLQECMDAMVWLRVWGLDPMTTAYLLRKADLRLSLNYCLLFLMSTQTAGAPVRSLKASFACPIFRIQKLPQDWAQAFQRMMGLMSLRTGLQYILLNMLSTSISMHFPLSNKYTLKVLVLPSYCLWSGILALKISGKCARLASDDTKQQFPSAPCLISSALKLKDTQGFQTISDAETPSQKMLYYQGDLFLDGVNSQTPLVQAITFREVKLTWFQNYLPTPILNCYLGIEGDCCWWKVFGLFKVGWFDWTTGFGWILGAIGFFLGTGGATG